MYRTGRQLSSVHVMLAFAGGLLTVACTHETDGPVRGVAYYQSHPAEWEQRVWVCTNDPASFDPTPECTAALVALRSEDKPVEGADLASSTERSSIRR